MHSTDRQLLFGVLALQMDFITPAQFAEACTVWASRKETSLPGLLAERGWLQAQDVQDIDRLLARKVERHGGDVAASLREAGCDPRVQATLTSIPDDHVHDTLAPTPPPQGVSLLATRGHTTDSLGRYTLSHVHATGGIGRVWLAHDGALRRQVALKELRPERVANAFVQSRFLREAQVTGQLEHPGIVPIYEVGHRPDDNAPYYTMRFVRGRTLAEAAADYHRRRKHGEAEPLELRKLLTAFVGVCNAIAYAHSRGVLHRDLKPHNVILGDFGEVMVLDWGLARVQGEPEPGPPPVDLDTIAEGDATRAGQTLGTPGYMSPEQAAGRLDQLGPATDVFGLGAILYYLLADQPPFTATTRDEAVRKAIEAPAPALADVGADVPPALEAVCRKALAKTPEDRYPTAAALADEVQRWLADEPVQAYPDPLYVRAGRWMRRHRPFVAASSVFLVCATLATAGAAALIWHEQRETERNLARTTDFISDVVDAVDSHEIDPNKVRQVIVGQGVEVMHAIRRERPDDDRVTVIQARLLLFDATAKRVGRLFGPAMAALEEAVALLEPLAAKSPDPLGCRSLLAQALYTVGASKKEAGGRRQDAAAPIERAIRLCEEGARGDAAAKAHLGIALNELASVQFGWQPMEATERTALRAADHFRTVVAQKPADQTRFERLFEAAAWIRAADCQREARRVAEALASLEKGSKILDDLCSSSPTDGSAILFRAEAWIGQARALAAADPKRLDDARNALTEAVRLGEALTKAASVDVFTILLASASARRADLFRQESRWKDADDDLQTAEKALARIPDAGRRGAEYLAARVLVAGIQARVAFARKDADRDAKLAAARTAYQQLLQLDPDNELKRKELEGLETDAKAASL